LFFLFILIKFIFDFKLIFLGWASSLDDNCMNVLFKKFGIYFRDSNGPNLNNGVELSTLVSPSITEIVD